MINELKAIGIMFAAMFCFSFANNDLLGISNVWMFWGVILTIQASHHFRLLNNK